MKTGNVILAIFLWLLIPVVGIFSGIGGTISGGSDNGTICCFTSTGILFIIGLVVLLIGREKPEHQIGTAKKSDRRCPNCGRVIPFDAKVCPYCSKKFEAHLKGDEVKTEEKEEIQEDNSYICSKCGYENIKEAKFCGECGNKL